MSAPAAPFVLRPRAVLATRERWLPGGVLLVREGRIDEVCADASSLRRRLGTAEVRWIELPDLVLTPGLVNAHAHLELTALAGRTPRAAAFTAWVGALLSARADLDAAAWTRSWMRGAARALATGTTWIGDIDSSAAWRAARGPAPRVLVYRELLDASRPERLAAALALLEAPFETRDERAAGLSPHAPHTVSSALLAAVARVARERAWPVGVHWAETREEVEWLAHGTGPFAPVLGPAPRQSGLQQLASQGLLGPRTALFHGNHPEPGDAERIASAGATLVHCPGTQAFFAREPFPLARWRAAGVCVALGTDSLASNDDLDLRLELQRLRAVHPALEPGAAWEMATLHGARALGGAEEAGLLAPGRRADLVAWRLAARDLGAALDELTAARPAVEKVWIGGQERVAGPLPSVW